MPAVCVCVCFFPSNFAFNSVWLAVNEAWLVLGINDMTRDTPLLEFSQVRASPIDGTPLPLCLPCRRMKAPLFVPLFLLFFQLIKESDGHKRAFWGGYEDGRGGKWESRSDAEESSAVCLNAWRGLRANGQLRAGRSLSPSAVGPAAVPSRSGVPWLSPRSLGRFLSYRLSPSGFGEGGRRRRGAAPQWISGWHGGGSLLGVCALPRVPACLF